MKAIAIFLCIHMVTLVSTLPIISKPLEDSPDHLVWEALLTVDTHHSDDKTRKIPKSIFITPNLNESKGNCPPDHKLGPDGRCYKTLKIDPLVILKTQIESLLKKNRTATTEYDEDYDYSEYGESTESMSSNGQYTIPLSLGFGSENRIPLQQLPQTTFPNLNRVVKDDAHVAPAMHITNEKMNQPFLVSTTGLDMGSEDFSIESKSPESSSSVATASSILPSSTKMTATLETTTTSASSSSSSSSSSINTTENLVASSIASTTANVQVRSTTASSDSEIVSDDSILLSSSTTGYNVSSSYNVSSTEMPDASTTFSSSIKNNQTDNESEFGTDKMEEVTLNTASDERPEQNTETSDDVPTSVSVENVEATTIDQTESTEQSQNSSGTPMEAISLQSSTSNSLERVATQNDSSKLPLAALAQTNTEDSLSDLTGNSSTISQVNDAILSPERKQQRSDDATDVKEVEDPPAEEPIDSFDTKMINIPSPNTTESNATTFDDRLPSKSDSYEVIDAYFIAPQSEILEEIDPATGKNSNGSVAEPRYRLENTSLFDDELSEAEIAPIINTGNGGGSSFELVEEMVEPPRDQYEDEKKNLSSRLAEELLFQGANTENPKNGSVTINEFSTVANPVTRETSTRVNARQAVEETLDGVPFKIGADLGFDITTEEPIDYDLRENKGQTESINMADSSSETTKNIEYSGELPEREPVPFDTPLPVSEDPYFQSPAPQPLAVLPSIYSTFLSRLKSTPPFVALQDHHQPETVQYSHSPFDIATAVESVNLDRRITQAATTDPTFALTNTNHRFQQSPVRNKSLQIGINCYLKSLVNKQQFIICDSA